MDEERQRGLISLRQFLAADLWQSVIPECLYRESRKNSGWTPDKDIRGDNFGINPHKFLFM